MRVTQKKALLVVPASLLLAVAGLCALPGPTRAGAPVPVKTLASIPVPASGGSYDLLRVDGRRHRLLGAHENDGTADYFDLTSVRLLKRVKLGGAVDTAVDADSTRYYVSVHDAGRVAVLDADTLEEVGSVKLAGPTDAILYEPKRRRVYVTHDDGGDVWVIDPATLTLTGQVQIPGAPELMEYDALSDRIYLSIKTRDSVVAIEPGSNQVVAEWSTAPAKRPHGLALDPAHHLILVAGANGVLAALDSGSGKVVATAAIASKVDQIAYDVSHSLLYCAGPGRMTVIRVQGATLAEAGEIPTAATAHNVAVDTVTGAVWSTYTDGKSSFAQGWVAQQ